MEKTVLFIFFLENSHQLSSLLFLLDCIISGSIIFFTVWRSLWKRREVVVALVVVVVDDDDDDDHMDEKLMIWIWSLCCIKLQSSHFKWSGFVWKMVLR
jgi:hypothetical protein